jgi:hypothetical protein
MNRIAETSLYLLRIPALAFCLGAFLTCSRAATPTDVTSEAVLPQRPIIVKKGTIDLDLCETTPFVFHGKLYRLEWFRSGSYLRIMDHDTQTEVSRFGAHHRFPCAYAEGDTVYVIGTKEDRGWFGNTLTVFTSKDLLHWDEHVAFQDKDYGMCNTSVCKADGRYVMSIEVNSASKETNGTFAGRFLESHDLIHWTLTPRECRHGFDGGLCSPHLLRWHNGWYYLFSTVGGHPTGYVLLLDRSRDLKTWEASPFNPVMFADGADKLILNAKLTPEQRAKIAKARDCDNSDIDFCDYNDKLIINYNWGDQQDDYEFIAEAQYAGTTGQFLEAWFPDMRPWASIDLSQPPSTFLKRRAEFGRVVSATGATVTTSSTHAGQPRNAQQLLSGSCASGFAFHTEPESNPWVTIDLGREAAITGVLVRNRTDCCQERAAGLRLQISGDGQRWREIWKADSVQASWEIPLLGQKLRTRYVRFDTHPEKPTPLHLQHLEIWGSDR